MEKHKIKVSSASIMVGEKNVISKSKKNLFHIERICFGAQTKWTMQQEIQGQFWWFYLGRNINCADIRSRNKRECSPVTVGCSKLPAWIFKMLYWWWMCWWLCTHCKKKKKKRPKSIVIRTGEKNSSDVWNSTDAKYCVIHKQSFVSVWVHSMPKI